MNFPIAPVNIIFELICFAAFAVICGSLLKPRFSVKACGLITACCLAVIAGIQAAVFLASDGSLQLVLTLLPVTAYLPAILAVHALSKNGFATSVVTWAFGLLTPYILNLLRNLLLAVGAGLPVDWLWLATLCSLALATVLVFITLRFGRKPFQQFEFHNKYVWIIIPVILVLSLVSYVENTNFTPLLAAILLLNLLAAFLFIIKFLNVAMSEQTARSAEQAVVAQLDLQRKEIARIRQKVEQERIYRHDMRHHLSVLGELADRENADDIRQYIGDLNARLFSVEKEDYCENATVNAVLAAYIGQAKQQDIRVAVKTIIPQELPVDEIDVCTILANALDNAVAACLENEKERWIELDIALHDNGNFSMNIRNACDSPVDFGKDDMPVTHKGAEHGLGLKSVNAVVQKYSGLLRCTWDDCVFRLSAVLFQPDNVPAEPSFGVKRAVSNTAVTILLLLCFINVFPSTVQALENVPIVGDLLSLASFRTERSSFTWGSSNLSASFPQIEWEASVSAMLADISENTEGSAKAGSPASPEPEAADDNAKPQSSVTIQTPDISTGVGDMNRQMEAYIQSVKEEFLRYFAQKYQGYVASDTGYNILRNDESLLSVCFYTTINAGGSGEYSRCFTLDKATGKVLTLSELFVEDSDYIGVISADIIRQMTQQAEAGEGDYFIPGGIWSPEECFKAIAPDQNFYIDESNTLVIIFDEYEVAPGSMGMPRFSVATAVLNDILLRPSLLSTVEKEVG